MKRVNLYKPETEANKFFDSNVSWNQVEQKVDENLYDFIHERTYFTVAEHILESLGYFN